MSNDSLPFTEAMQEAIVGHAISDEKFFLRAIVQLKSQWFTKDILVANIFEQICVFYNMHKLFPGSPDELLSEQFFLEQMPAEQEKYKITVMRCLQSARNFHIDILKKHLTGFIRVSKFKESIEGAAKRYKAQGFDKTYDWTKAKLQEIQNATFEDDGLVLPLTDPHIWMTKTAESAQQAVSTGNAKLDDALGGGLFKGDTSAIMAPVNCGKTTFLVTIARHAVRQKQNVLFISHEGRPDSIRMMIFSSFMGIARNALLYKWCVVPEKMEIIRQFSEILSQNLTYMPYNKTGQMFIEDVVAEIKKLNEDVKLKTGRGFDLIIDDYPKKLRSRYRTGKDASYRSELAEIYDQFNQLAIELDAHCMVAVQTNRQGLKQNNGYIESDQFLGMTEIDESFGIAQNLGNIITLNRSHEDRQSEVLHLNIAKSRNSKTDIVIHTRTNYACSLTHGDKGTLPEWNKLLVAGLEPHEYLDGNYLASYHQDDNKKEGTTLVNTTLMEIEGKRMLPNDVGAYIPQQADGPK